MKARHHPQGAVTRPGQGHRQANVGQVAKRLDCRSCVEGLREGSRRTRLYECFATHGGRGPLHARRPDCAQEPRNDNTELPIGCPCQPVLQMWQSAARLGLNELDPQRRCLGFAPWTWPMRQVRISSATPRWPGRSPSAGSGWSPRRSGRSSRHGPTSPPGAPACSPGHRAPGQRPP